MSYLPEDLTRRDYMVIMRRLARDAQSRGLTDGADVIDDVASWEISESKPVVTVEQVANAMTEADNAFWAALAEHLPQITTGDFPPDAHAAWWLAVRRAVACWVSGNMPLDFSNPGAFDQADAMAKAIMEASVTQ